MKNSKSKMATTTRTPPTAPPTIGPIDVLLLLSLGTLLGGSDGGDAELWQASFEELRHGFPVYKNTNPVSRNCGGMLPEKLLFMIFKYFKLDKPSKY
jgi:hypothetical protein